MATKPINDGPLRLIDPLTGRPVAQFTATHHYYVRTTAARHFWGRTLDCGIFLAAFGLLSLLVMIMGVILAPSSSDSVSDVLLLLLILLWFPSIYVYGMIWGAWGLVGDRAARMRSVRLKDGSLSGPWIGGWRAILWSFFPVYVFFMIASLLDGGFDHRPRYIPLDLDSGVSQGHAPLVDAALMFKEGPASEAAGQADIEGPSVAKSDDGRGDA